MDRLELLRLGLVRDPCRGSPSLFFARLRDLCRGSPSFFLGGVRVLWRGSPSLLGLRLRDLCRGSPSFFLGGVRVLWRGSPSLLGVRLRGLCRGSPSFFLGVLRDLCRCLALFFWLEPDSGWSSDPQLRGGWGTFLHLPARFVSFAVGLAPIGSFFRLNHSASRVTHCLL